MKFKSIQQVVPFSGLLAVLLFGCYPLQQKLQSVEVVAMANTEGVEIEALTAKPYSVPIDENNSVEKEQVQYYFVPNHDILAAIQAKLGKSYSTLLDQYQSAQDNAQSLALYPQLGIQYKFRANAGKFETEYVSFKLSEVFDGIGALIRMKGEQSQIWVGKTHFFQKLTDEKISAGERPILLADLFDLQSGLQIFKHGASGFFVFQSKSSGKIFDLSFVGDHFQLNGLASSLPAVANTSRVVVARAGTNGFLFFFVDASSVVSHIYLMDQGLVLKELVGQCPQLLASGVVDGTKLSCQ